MEYKCIITPRMRAVADSLKEAFVGMDHCITDTGRNLIVEIPKSKCESVRSVLKQRFQDVALIRNAYPMMEDLHDFILVKPLITESPVFENDGVLIPNLEKRLVDYDADKEYATLTDQDIQREFQRAKEEIRSRLDRIDQDRVATVRTIQDYFRQEPVERAWIFGSFSRMEERPDSDVDILVDLDASSPIGLLQYAGMINRLEALLGRKVDLVAKDSVKPFARESVNRDKVLVYERA